MVLSERDLAELNEAKKANFVLRDFGEFLEREKKSQLEKIEAEFRSECNEKKITNLFAAYVALKDLESSILRTVKRASKIEEEQING